MKVEMSEAEWRAKSDMRTLIEAQRIRDDAKRMGAVRKVAKKSIEEIQLIESKASAKKATSKPASAPKDEFEY